MNKLGASKKNLKTLEDGVVKLTGAQTVAGVKEFSDGATIGHLGNLHMKSAGSESTAIRFGIAGDLDATLQLRRIGTDLAIRPNNASPYYPILTTNTGVDLASVQTITGTKIFGGSSRLIIGGSSYIQFGQDIDLQKRTRIYGGGSDDRLMLVGATGLTGDTSKYIGFMTGDDPDSQPTVRLRRKGDKLQVTKNKGVAWHNLLDESDLDDISPLIVLEDADIDIDEDLSNRKLYSGISSVVSGVVPGSLGDGGFLIQTREVGGDELKGQVLIDVMNSRLNFRQQTDFETWGPWKDLVVPYDNTESELVATTVQGAIDELKAKIDDLENVFESILEMEV